MLPKAYALDKVTYSFQYDRIWKKIDDRVSCLVILELRNGARLFPLIKLAAFLGHTGGLADSQSFYLCVD